jgi:hypothetical protein
MKIGVAESAFSPWKISAEEDMDVRSLSFIKEFSS